MVVKSITTLAVVAVASTVLVSMAVWTSLTNIITQDDSTDNSDIFPRSTDFSQLDYKLRKLKANSHGKLVVLS